MTIGTQRLRLLRGNTAAASAFTGLGGELIVDTDLGSVRVQDGYTPGGTLLATAASLGNIALDQLTNGSYSLVLDTNGDAVIPGNLVSANASLTSYIDLHKNGLGGVEIGAYTDFTVLTLLGGSINEWNFGTDGNLTIAGNINYANGVSILNGITANSGGNYSNANVAAYLPTYSGNIGLGNITSNAADLTLSVGVSDWVFDDTGVLTAPGEINTPGNVSAWYFIGNGSQLTGIAASSNYGNANVAAYLPTYTGVVSAANLSFQSNGYIRGSSNQIGLYSSTVGAFTTNAASVVTTENFYIQSGNKQWTFDNGFGIQFPDNTFQTTAYTTAAVDAEVSSFLTSTFLPNYTGNISAGNVMVSGNLIIANGGNIIQQNFYGNTGNFYGDPTTGFGAFYAGKTGFTPVPQTLAQISGNYNSYAQVNLENQNGGDQATADYIVTADNGTDSTYYIDLGIASSGYNGLVANNSLGTSLYANDAYLYAQGNTNVTVGGNLIIGTTTDSKNIKFISGGSNIEHIAVQINHPTRSNTLQVTGGITASNITFPVNYVYSGNTFTSPESNGILKNFKWEFSDTSSGADTVTLQWNLLDTTFPQWYLTTNSQGNIYVFDGDAKTIGFLDNSINSGTVTFGTAANNGAGSSNDIELTTITGNAYVRTGSNSWRFDTSGNLTLPVVFSDPPTSPPSTVNGIQFLDALQTTAWTGIAPVATRLSSTSGDHYFTVDNGTGNVSLPGNLEVYGDTVLLGFGAKLTQSNSSAVIAAQAEVDSYGDWQANIGGLEPYTLSNTPNGATTFANVVINSSSSADALGTWITDAWAIQQGTPGDPLWIEPAISSALYNQLRSFFAAIGGSYYRLEEILQSVDLVTGNSVYTFGSDGNLIIPNVASIIYANGVNILSGLAGTYSNVNVAAYLSSNSNITVTTTGNVTGGNIITRGQIMSTSYSGGNISWSAANQTDFQGAIKVGSNIIKSAGGASSITLNNNGANIPILGVTQTIASTSSGTGALIVSGGAGIAGNVVAGGNVSGTYFIGNGALLTGIASSSGNYSDSNVAAYLPTYTGNVGGTLTTAAQPYITSVGNLTAANITGNLAVSNITTTGNITGNQPNVTLVAGSYNYTFANTGNVSGITNIFASGYYYANGTAFVGGGGTNYTNANLANIGSNVIVTTGNITAGNLIGIHVGNAVGTTATYTGNITAGNLVGNAVGTTATYTGNVTAANVTVSANVVANNLITTGTNGNITGVNIVYANTIVASGYGITMANRPAMRVYGNSSNVIVAGTTLTNANYTVDYNQGNALVSSTGIFTAPVAGLYSVTLIARVSTNNGLNQIGVFKNNNTSGANVIAFWETDTNAGTAVHFAAAGVANMAVGDTLRARVLTGNVLFDSNDSMTFTYIG